MRHPLDPDAVRDTKATAVLALGIAALLAGPLIGGVIPATAALLLARQVRPELRAARGFLVGADRVRVGVGLAWAGIVLAAAAVTIAVIVGILDLASGAGQDFAPTID